MKSESVSIYADVKVNGWTVLLAVVIAGGLCYSIKHGSECAEIIKSLSYLLRPVQAIPISS